MTFKYLEQLLKENNKNNQELLEIYIKRAKENKKFLDKVINDFVDIEYDYKDINLRNKLIEKRIIFCKEMNN